MGCLASKVKPSATGVDSPELPDDAEVMPFCVTKLETDSIETVVSSFH